MSNSANEISAVPSPPPPGEPDAHGQAALVLVESILHALVEKSTLSPHEALDVIQSAQEIKTEVATQSGESKSRMRESLELLKRIALSFETNLK